jgi:hypothetical protein
VKRQTGVESASSTEPHLYIAPECDYNRLVVRQVDAIFSHGAFRPLEALAIPEGTRVHLSVEEEARTSPEPPAAKILTPKLAHPEDAADFVMEVRETGNAGV